MSRRLLFKHNRPANVHNHYVVGSGVGSKSRFVRSALIRRSSNNAQGKPCCLTRKQSQPVHVLSENKSCLNGKVWKECGSACTRTCSDPNPVCTEQCVPQCECPEGQVWEDEKCMDASMCGFYETTPDTSSDVSCGALGGAYIKDKDGTTRTKYCCTKFDGSGCISNSKDDVCIDTTSSNIDLSCLNVYGFSNCTKKPPTISCDTSPAKKTLSHMVTLLQTQDGMITFLHKMTCWQVLITKTVSSIKLLVEKSLNHLTNHIMDTFG